MFKGLYCPRLSRDRAGQKLLVSGLHFWSRKIVHQIKLHFFFTKNCFIFQHKANGQALFDEVCRHLNLLESDYFGLEFIDVYGNKVWLDKEKSILRQITSTQSDARFYFIIKFYTPNPADLEEEYTR